MGSLHNNIHLIGPTLFLLYINDFSDVVGIYQLSNQWQQLDVIYRTLWAGAESALLISILKKFNWFCLTSAIDVRMYGLVIVEKSVSYWIGALTLSLLQKLPSRKLEPWFFIWSFILPKSHYISINVPYSHGWNTVAMSGLLLLSALWLIDKLQ